MKIICRRIIICSLLAVFSCSLQLFADRKQLREGLVRFHVVANSDGEKDQAIKYNVRDAVLNSISTDLKKISDVGQAREYLQENLPKIQKIVDDTLDDLGFEEGAYVSLCKEAFDIRHYDTFTLPAGVYDSLRIVIGEGQGRNWWCVSFPSLCIPATTSGFEDAAVSAGFSGPLTKTLSGDETYEIHFFFLNQLGKLENIFFQG